MIYQRLAEESRRSALDVPAFERIPFKTFTGPGVQVKHMAAPVRRKAHISMLYNNRPKLRDRRVDIELILDHLSTCLLITTNYEFSRLRAMLETAMHEAEIELARGKNKTIN